MVKIVTTAINLACLTVTLFRPGNTTCFALIPSIITAAGWIIGTSRKVKRSVWPTLLITVAAVSGALCFILGFISKIIRDTNAAISSYSIRFSADIAFLAGKKFEYAILAIPVFALFIALSISEIVACSSMQDEARQDGSFDGRVNAALRLNR